MISYYLIYDKVVVDWRGFMSVLAVQRESISFSIALEKFDCLS